MSSFTPKKFIIKCDNMDYRFVVDIDKDGGVGIQREVRDGRKWIDDIDGANIYLGPMKMYELLKQYDKAKGGK